VFFLGAVYSQEKWLIRQQLMQMVAEVALVVNAIGRHNTCGGGGRALGAACWCGHGCG
jgi:hypothetical protein